VPDGLGADAADLAVSSSDPDQPIITVPFTGSGVNGIPNIEVLPGSVDFGTVTIGTRRSAQVMIRNTGSSDLTVSSLTVTGSTDFRTNTDLVPPFVVRPGRTEWVQVDFIPSAATRMTATLDIASDDPDPGQSLVMVPLEGIGQPGTPDIDVTPLTIDFGVVTEGTSAGDFVTIRNFGDEDLTVTGFAITGAGAGNFLVIPANAPAPFTVRPNRSEVLFVYYLPTGLTTDNATLEITSDDPDEPTVSVALTGTGG